MLNALRNIRPTHLLDPDVARAWAERAPEIRPHAAGEARPSVAVEPVEPAGEPGKLRLRVVE
jgi:hypothetical protein